ncbi:hypothetical protein BI364_16635 [Acidihalobacter yilgarnensis]|uniref:Cytochrome b561 bacterial/Ni-hydrogenase domain-containing protein n=1 Tax=Acidihalobacter yilgarnensis TaxID=2819280 RepID=A0A1D8IS78_9GAMM|nr:cytochrome b/b6 domain-containing protein [Acidihalobacter yilgarnensis]AOU99339.1 hypothetical protein BI364_16635 [Acidihalobacter yilgarnensis]
MARWDGPSKIYHWLLSFAISFELFSSTLMSDVSTNSAFPAPSSVGVFDAHQIGGITCALILAAYIRRAWRDPQVRDRLFPWLRPGAMRPVLREARALLRGHLPPAGAAVGLPGFIHGLGLLVMLGMAVTGVLNILLRPGVTIPFSLGFAPSFFIYSVESVVHNAISVMAWVYWIGHVAFAIIHEAAGQGVLRAMFAPSPPTVPDNAVQVRDRA